MKTLWKFIWIFFMVVLLCSMHVIAEQKRLRSMPDPRKMESSHTMSYSQKEMKEFLTSNDQRRRHSL